MGSLRTRVLCLPFPKLLADYEPDIAVSTSAQLTMCSLSARSMCSPLEACVHEYVAAPLQQTVPVIARAIAYNSPGYRSAQNQG
jgi:hypothetical protein